MNNFYKIALPSVAVAVAVLVLLAHSPFANAATIDEETVKMGHGFELARGESLTLAHHHKPVTYRVCIEDVPGIVPLEVAADGRTFEVIDGTCTDVVGAHISVKPSTKLPHDQVMVGHFEQVKK